MITLKPGQYEFEFNGRSYKIEKENYTDTYGWRKVRRTRWITDFGGEHGTIRDTKEDLIFAINRKIENYNRSGSFH